MADRADRATEGFYCSEFETITYPATWVGSRDASASKNGDPPPGRDRRGYENPKTPILRLAWPAYVTQPGKRKVDFREHFWFLLTSNLNLSMAQPQRTVFWEDGI